MELQTPPHLESLSVLLVEDDPATQELVRAQLAPVGIAIDPVSTMFDALEILALEPGMYRCVVVDLGLPDTGGVDSIDNVITATAAPVVVFSGSTDPRVREKVVAHGAAAFVSKDEGTDRLAEVITDASSGTAPKLAGLPEAVRASAVSGDYEAVVARTLRFLNRQIPMGTWMFTRVQGDDWVVLDAVGEDYDILAGTVLRWSDSFCSRMVEGAGPRITLEPDSVQAYRDAPVARQLDIGTYIGLPLAIEGLGLFGTLCGISPDVVQVPFGIIEPYLSNLGEVLSAAVALDLERDRLQRRLDLAKIASTSDTLTGLPNRRAFDLMHRVEEARCRRYGSSAAVLVIDLDGLKDVNDSQGHDAGDRLLAATGRALSSAKRAADMAFRIGGDEFAVLATECREEGLPGLIARFRGALDDAGVAASVGGAVRRPDSTMLAAIATADERMYAEKRQPDESEESGATGGTGGTGERSAPGAGQLAR